MGGHGPWSFAALGLLAMGLEGGGDAGAAAGAKILQPAVAGLFYPVDPRRLDADLDALLAKAKNASIPKLCALICPHAGYPYSGPVAAEAYRQLIGRDFKRVVVIGPSHHASFQGLAIPDADAYRTPLGDVKISPDAKRLGRLKPFAVEPPCRVQRPSWWKDVPQGAQPSGQDTPFTWEHSVEVQLPFLQKVLPGVPVIPVVFGEADPRDAARVLEGFTEGRTLIIVSSDLSHFHAYEEAQRLDAQCVKAACELDTARMARAEACGKQPIQMLLHLAKAKGWKARLLDCRNSGDTAGSKESVVGYAAIAFYRTEGQGEAAKRPPVAEGRRPFSVQERQLMLLLARKSLVAAVSGSPMAELELGALPERLREKRACFVTLTKGGQLRGCIGHILPREALVQSLIHNARAAALEDPRFTPVRATELPKLDIEVSVLTVPEPLDFSSPEELLKKLRPKVDGVVLMQGARQATFLPQVWEELPDKAAFLKHLSLKAGGTENLWRQKDVEVWTYQVEAFKEK